MTKDTHHGHHSHEHHKHTTLEELRECSEQNNLASSPSTKQLITKAIDELINDPKYKDFNPYADRNKTIRLIASKMFSKDFHNQKNLDTITNIIINEVSVKNNMDIIKEQVIAGHDEEEVEEGKENF
jgi:hypothetical protein